MGDKQWVQFGDDESSRFEFKAERTNQGTTPAGSTWTKNPIPAYDCPTGGALGHAFDGTGGLVKQEVPAHMGTWPMCFPLFPEDRS